MMMLTTTDDKTKQKTIVARQLKRTNTTLATLDIIHTIKMAANKNTSDKTPVKMLSDEQINVVRRAIYDIDEAQYSAGAAFRSMWQLKEEMELDDGQPLSLAIRKLQVARDEAAKVARSVLTAMEDKLPTESYYECRDRLRRRVEIHHRSDEEMGVSEDAEAQREQPGSEVDAPPREDIGEEGVREDKVAGSVNDLAAAVITRTQSAPAEAVNPPGVNAAAPQPAALRVQLGVGQLRPPRVPAAENIGAAFCFCCCLFSVRPCEHPVEDCPYYVLFPRSERAWIAAATGRCYKCLKNTHQSRTCPSPPGCKACGGLSHHTLVHDAPSPYYFSPQFQRRMLKDWRVAATE